MNFQTLMQMVVETIRTPRDVAARLLALDIPRQTVWMAFALLVVLNAVVFFVAQTVLPPSPEAIAAMPSVMRSPFLFAILLGGMLVVTIHAIFWTGQAMGGQGRLGDILVVMTWLQVLRLAAQVALFVLQLVLGNVAALLAMVAGLWGLWILVEFVDVAHRFDNRARAFGVLIGAMVALFFGLMIMVTLIGVVAMGS